MTSRQEANISRFIDCSEVQMAGSSGPLCRVMADPLESQGIVKFLQRTMCTARVASPPSEHRRMFQIVRLALDDNGEVTARRPLQPCFELWEDAIAMAEFDASRLWGDYGCDEERDCWWATDTRGRKYRFVIEQVRPTDIAA